jgi:hypothetical protein
MESDNIWELPCECCMFYHIQRISLYRYTYVYIHAYVVMCEHTYKYVCMCVHMHIHEAVEVQLVRFWKQTTLEIQLHVWNLSYLNITKYNFFMQYWGLNSEPLYQPFFCDGFFWDRVSQTICPDWLWTMILSDLCLLSS